MSGFFQRLFGKDNKPAIARGPLGLHLNSGFTLDTLAFRLLEDELLIALPGEEFTVYSAAIFLIPICISFDTAEKRRYATYLILNRRFSFEF
ncbi:YjfK family protein [Escherichia coli]|nr:YjfK family protein [Escherichia coli]